MTVKQSAASSAEKSQLRGAMMAAIAHGDQTDE